MFLAEFHSQPTLQFQHQAMFLLPLGELVFGIGEKQAGGGRQPALDDLRMRPGKLTENQRIDFAIVRRLLDVAAPEFMDAVVLEVHLVFARIQP